jgi:integrase/recombinase XerD
MLYTTELITHKNKKRIAVRFANTPSLNARIKKVEGAQWSQTLKTWHVPDTAENRQRFKLNASAEKTNKPLEPKQIAEQRDNDLFGKTDTFKNWLKSKRYSPNTIKTYSEALMSFLKFYNDKPVAEITNNDIIVFNNEHILKHGFSASYQNQVVNAIKLFFSKIENRKLNIELIHRPKKEKLLPNVLT